MGRVCEMPGKMRGLGSLWWPVYTRWEGIMILFHHIWDMIEVKLWVLEGRDSGCLGLTHDLCWGKPRGEQGRFWAEGGASEEILKNSKGIWHVQEMTDQVG